MVGGAAQLLQVRVARQRVHQRAQASIAHDVECQVKHTQYRVGCHQRAEQRACSRFIMASDVTSQSYVRDACVPSECAKQ